MGNGNGRWVWLIGLVLLFGLVAGLNAWVSDDAYITFRTVDNFIHGYGLTWNVGERVQVYTHPLWMLLVAGVARVTGEVYFASLGLSLVLGVVAVGVLVWRGVESRETAVVVLLLLTLSKAFVDYSTSGLENPLSHVLVVLFGVAYVRGGGRRLFWLSLWWGLTAVNRLDLTLLLLPTLLTALVTEPQPWGRRLGAVLAGWGPLLGWELFSLFYYGFFFPNTAYAKLTVGLISRMELLAHGWAYFINSWRWDPLTLTVIGLSLVVAVWRGQRRLWPLLAGIGLYLGYVGWIGGDFMSGRFFAAPLLLAVLVWGNVGWEGVGNGRYLLYALCLLLGLLNPHAPVWPSFTQLAGTDDHGITDEKGNYWPSTSLIGSFGRANTPAHDWADDGQRAREEGRDVVERGSVGFYGYFAGPEVYVVDLLGLADPLLARLPPVDPNWRIGHYGRRAPEGYLDSLRSGENQLRDPNLAAYYDKLSRLTRAPLGDMGRLGEIVRFNLGAYDPWRDAYARFGGTTWTSSFQFTNVTGEPYVFAYVWNNETAQAYRLDDVSVAGRVYGVTWTIRPDGASMVGVYQEQIATLSPLSAEETLNIGVFFSEFPDLSLPHRGYEYRYWFRLDGGELLVARQGVPWQNEEAPGGVWRETAVTKVIWHLPEAMP